MEDKKMKILKSAIMLLLATMCVLTIVQCQKEQRRPITVPDELEKGQHKQVYYDYYTYYNN
jgi:uncharacterized lipoprotein YehR (DUF1307 family)